MARYTGRTCRLLLMLFLNVCCFFMELVFGFLSNSMVLTADAFNVLSDLLGVAIALACMKLATRGPSEKNTYGWERCQDLGAFVNAVFMITLCVTIIIQSLQRFIDPEPVDQPRTVLIVGATGLCINLIGLLVLKDYRSISKQESHEDSTGDQKSMDQSKRIKDGSSSHRNMYGAFLHVLADALGSVIVIGCASIDWLLPRVYFLQNYLDPILSIFMAAMLIVSSFGLMKQSSLILLQAVPDSIDLKSLTDSILAQSDHIVQVNDLHVWQLSSEKLVASVRISLNRALTWERMEKIVAMVESCFYQIGIHIVSVKPELTGIMTLPATNCKNMPAKTDQASLNRVPNDEVVNLSPIDPLYKEPGAINSQVTIWI